MITRAALALLLVVSCGKTALHFAPDALPEGKAQQSYRVPITVTGAHTPVGGMSVSQGALPPGLELHFDRDGQPKNTGILEGTPTKPGEYAFTVAVWCYGTNVSGQSGAREYRIVIR